MSPPPSEQTGPLRQRSLRTHWLMLLLALALLAAQMAYDLFSSRTRIEAEAQSRLENHSLVLVEELERRISAINAVLLHMRSAIQRIDFKSEAQEINSMLATLVDTTEGLRTLLILDVQGTVVASSRPEVFGKNFVHREYFQRLQNQPRPDRLHLSQPFITVLGVFTLTFTRPIYGANGEFLGIVAATLDADSLQQLMESLHAGATTRLAVVHGDGTLLKLVPVPPGLPAVPPSVDAAKPGSFFFRHLQSGRTANLLTGVSAMTGTKSVVSMRTVQPAAVQMDAPLVASAGRDLDDVLVDWGADARQRLITFAFVVTVSVLALLAYRRRQRVFERAMHQTEGAHQRSTLTLQRFIDHLPGTAYVKDAESHTLMANQGFKSLLGMDPASMIGKTTRELFPPEFAAKIEADDQKVLDSGQTVTIEESFNGNDYASIKFVIDAGGERQLGGITLDITPRKRAERAMAEQMVHLRELNEKLEAAQTQLLQSEKMASLGQLAAGVAHELNNPIGFVNSNLGTLKGYVDDIFLIATVCEAAAQEAANPADFARIQAIKAAKDFDFLKEDIYQLLHESLDGLQRVKKIVQDLKDFSRPGEAEWQWADINQGLESTLNIAWNELKYKCTVNKQFGALPRVYCLISQLNQVFMNLLVNAAQAIETRGEITITTRQQDGHSVEIVIADTGKGIAPDHLHRLFEPFFTTKPVGQGTGLGLSIAWGIIQKHHGSISADSTPGSGTTFSIRLPIEPDSAPASTANTANNHGSAQEKPQ